MTDANELQPIETAPRDGTVFLGRIPGHGDYLMFAAHGFENEDGNDCWAWSVVEDERWPEGWTDGICWASNENCEPSPKPTHWRPLPADET